ncbi:MAG: helix-turn-helix domain-containing protein [Betaproteobacteria bacterium]|nr:helix-turn-helix domain-containing protein [Betaproteobacteria bacterium]
MNMQVFCADELPVRGRLDAWLANLDQLFGVEFCTKPLGAEQFSARMSAFVGNDLKCAAVDLSPHITFHRPGARTQRTGGDFMLSLQKSGNAVVGQAGREACIGPGDIYLLDTAQQFRMETNAIRTDSVCMASNRMRDVFPQADGLTSVRIDCETGPGALLRSMLIELFQQSSNLDVTTSDRIADAIPHLVAAALGSLPAVGQECPSRLAVYHRERVRRFVRSELSNPELAPEMIARAIGLSARNLHHIFAEEPMTLMRWIWTERLKRCRAELALRSLQHRSVSDIAYSWGFNDPAHFSRSFRERFGQSPREFRQSVLQP